jgi:hypothetical protein
VPHPSPPRKLDRDSPRVPEQSSRPVFGGNGFGEAWLTERSTRKEASMLKFIGGTIGAIFLIGLLVVIGLLALIF